MEGGEEKKRTASYVCLPEREARNIHWFGFDLGVPHHLFTHLESLTAAREGGDVCSIDLTTVAGVADKSYLVPFLNVFFFLRPF